MPASITDAAVSEIAHLLRLVVRATDAKRVLEIGTGTGASGLAIASALPADGMLITLERDAAAAFAARQTFAGAGHAEKVSVMVGEAGRYLHKIRGPFDIVFQDGDVAQYEALHERLVQLLAPSATFVIHNIDIAGGYNEVLNADRRLASARLTIGNGIAIAVRRRDSHDA